MNKWSYWIKTGFINFLFYATAGILFGLSQGLVNNELTAMKVAATALYYSMALSTLLICSINITKTTYMANVVISMGETRKNSVLGINIMNFTTIFASVAVAFALSLITAGELIGTFMALVSLPAIYLVAVGCGMCINSLKLENTGTISGLQTILMLFSIVLLFGLLASTGTFAVNLTIVEIDNLATYITVFSFIAGILLCAIGNIRMKNKIMKLEVSL